MSAYFEEMDFRRTPMGVLSLRRRRQLSSGIDIFEIKLGDEFLMSSAFTAGEVALSRLGLAASARTNLDVVVGGLGLGYTEQSVLGNSRGGLLSDGDAVADVIRWHQQGLLSLGKQLMLESRLRFHKR